MLRAVNIFLRSFPPEVIAWKIRCKLLGVKMPGKEKWQNLFSNKDGIEIGGPSALFKTTGFLPVYPVVRSLNGINFSTSTVWEGQLSEGPFFKYGDKTGYQYIAEGSYLPQIELASYDFVLSCNNLEHIANPIAAIYQWKRIIKEKGAILLVLPNKLANFDHKRPYTSMEHLIDDFEKNVGEDDKTHLQEILKLHDLRRDPQAGSYKNFHERCLNNFENRCMHHHVFNQDLLRQVFQYCGMDTGLQFTSKTDHFIAAISR